jgi:hypothetical protein
MQRAQLKAPGTAKVLIVMALLGASFIAVADEPASGQKTTEVIIQDNMLTLNGQKFAMPTDRMVLEKILGKPSRSEEGTNAILIWDDLGVKALQNPESKKVFGLGLLLKTSQFGTVPKKPFSGKVTIDGSSVTADTDIKELAKSKKGKQLKLLGSRDEVWLIKHDDGTSVAVRAALDGNGKGVEYIEIDREVK